MQISKIIAAVKNTPNYRAQVELDGVTVEVIGSPNVSRWDFNYLTRIPADKNASGKKLTAYGRSNAHRTIDAWPAVEINTNIHTFK